MREKITIPASQQVRQIPWRTSLGFLLLIAHVAAAEVVKIDVQRRDDAGTHERVIGRVHFAIDPRLPANRAIADIDLAPKMPREGRVLLGPPVLQAKTRRPSARQRVPRGRQSRPRSVPRDHERRSTARPLAQSRGISATDSFSSRDSPWHSLAGSSTSSRPRV